MLKSLLIMAAATMIAACAPISLREETLAQMGHKPLIAVELPKFQITNLIVGESVRWPGKIWLSPVLGQAMRAAFNGEPSIWGAMRPEVEPVYRDAALRFLASKRGSCEITDSKPYPDQFGFEFDYRCQT